MSRCGAGSGYGNIQTERNQCTRTITAPVKAGSIGIEPSKRRRCGRESQTQSTSSTRA